MEPDNTALRDLALAQRTLHEIVGSPGFQRAIAEADRARQALAASLAPFARFEASWSGLEMVLAAEKVQRERMSEMMATVEAAMRVSAPPALPAPDLLYALPVGAVRMVALEGRVADLEEQNAEVRKQVRLGHVRSLFHGERLRHMENPPDPSN